MVKYYPCNICYGNFPNNLLVNSICLFCKHRTELQEELNAQRSKCNNLKEKILLLEAKVISLSEVQSLPSSEHVLQSSIDDNNDWQTVRNRNRGSVKSVLQPIMLSNRFECLPGTEENDPCEIRLVGDSIIKNQLNNFCARNKKKRQRHCIPGGKINDIKENFSEITKEDNESTHYVIHVGSNDVCGSREKNPDLIKKYKSLLEMFKNSGRNVTCSAVLPRKEDTSYNHNRIYNFNIQLRSLCKTMQIDYFSAWDDFLKSGCHYSHDNLHLSAVGSAKFGRLLNSHIKNFFQLQMISE